MKSIPFFGRFLIALLLSGCATGSTVSTPTGDVLAKRPQDAFTIEPAAERGLWMLRAFRQLDGFQAQGEIFVSSDITPPPDTPHAALAGSRTFLLLGQERLRAGDFPRAFAAAQAGLKELGDSYVRRPAFDDTSLSIGYAQDLMERGHPDRGARQILKALRSRIQMYVRKHAPFVRLPAEEAQDRQSE